MNPYSFNSWCTRSMHCEFEIKWKAIFRKSVPEHLSTSPLQSRELFDSCCEVIGAITGILFHKVVQETVIFCLDGAPVMLGDQRPDMIFRVLIRSATVASCKVVAMVRLTR